MFCTQSRKQPAARFGNWIAGRVRAGPRMSLHFRYPTFLERENTIGEVRFESQKRCRHNGSSRGRLRTHPTHFSVRLARSMNKVVLITGSSTGFGRATAETLGRRGYTVFATMRDSAGRNAGHRKR
jgi:hypothetical protein